MNRSTLALCLSLLLAHGRVHAQEKKARLPEVKPNLHGWLILPLPTGVPIFNDVTESVGQLDLRFQVPFSKKGWGAGAGTKGSLFSMRENALAPANIAGTVNRWTFYGQLQYERYTGPVTYYQFSAQMGTSKYTWDCASCPEPTKQEGLFRGVNDSNYVHATDNLAFGLLLGYERDDARLTPQQLCLDSYPGRTDKGPSAQYQFITVGLGFTTRFGKSPEGPGW